MHLVQMILPHHPAFDEHKDYYKQPLEIEALSKDIVFALKHMRVLYLSDNDIEDRIEEFGDENTLQ